MLSDATLVTLCGLTAAVAWGVSDFWSAKASKNLGPIIAALLVNVIGALTIAVLYSVLWYKPVHITPESLGYAIGGGVFLAFALVAFFKGLAAGPVSLVSPVAAAYPLVTTILALAVFKAHLAAQQVAGILLVVFGVMAATELLDFKRSNRKLGIGPSFALGAAACWGISFTLLSQAVGQLGWELLTAIELAVVVLALALLLPFIKGSEQISVKNLRRYATNRYIVGAGFASLLGTTALNLGLARETASGAIVTAVSASYPVLTMFLALRNFKERVKIVPLVGAVISVAGVVILSLG
ncbi:MAG TPA: DMT family transporter [Nevskiaceae bacterium]|nr:DMT family transporter [Nevskiaceae bacterium]